MIIILDVETISKEYNCISDIAWAKVKRNKITALKNFIPQEHLATMTTGEFSEPKIAATMEEIAKGNAIVAPFDVIMLELAKDFLEARYIYAYNAQFDRAAIIRTCQALQSKGTEFFNRPDNFEKWRDLWAWASNTILYKKSFIEFCSANNLLTPKGYCSTSAETCLKYLKNDTRYVEQHTAREDVKDEFQIYLAIKREIKREYEEILTDEAPNFKGKPFYTIDKLRKAIDS